MHAPDPRSTRRRRLRAALPAALLLAASSGTAAASPGPEAVLRVDDAAPLGGDGATWATAYRHLQDALTAAAARSGRVEIRIAGGVQRPDRDEAGAVTPGDRDASFVLAGALDLLGGHAGLGAKDPDHRDPDGDPTLLSGDLLGDDDGRGGGTDENARHVTRAAEGASLRLDGLVIERGRADADADPDGGAAMAVAFDASVAFHGCVIRDCLGAAGGAIEASHVSSLELVDCTLRDNRAEAGTAAALSGSFGADVVLDGCLLEGNVGWFAGAIFTRSTLQVHDCTFAGNVARHGTGGSGEAGGLTAIGNAAVTITDSTFRDNATEGSADAGAIAISLSDDVAISGCHFEGNSGFNVGGIHLEDLDGSGDSAAVTGCTFLGNDGYFGGALRASDVIDLTIADCRFEASVGFKGGAMHLHEVAGAIRDTLFLANRTELGLDAPDTYRGGAFLAESSSDLDVDRCRFLGNEAAGDAGAIFLIGTSTIDLRQSFLSGNRAGFVGGAIRKWTSSTLRIEGCTILANVAETGATGGVHSNDGLELLRHAILWGNLSPVGTTFDAQVAGLIGGPPNVIEGYDGTATLVIADDPLLVDPDGPDDVAGTEDDDWHLLPESPGANAGTASYVPPAGTTDLEGDPRRVFCAVDLGCDELLEAARDCDGNGNPDRCDLIDGAADCNANGVPDACDVASGASGDCNENGVPDECDGVVAAYLVDDGDGDQLFIVDGQDVLWLNAFTVRPGDETIGAVHSIWGRAFDGIVPVRLLVYDDPNDDGDPNDAELLLSLLVAATPTELDEFAVIPIPPTFVGNAGERFFVGFAAHGSIDEAILAGDEDDPYQGASWYASAATGAIDLEDLASNPIPPTPMHEFGFPLNFCVRAAGANGCACVRDLDESGAVDFGDLVHLLARWGPCPGCPADLDFDGAVGTSDLLLLLAAWGPCPG